MFKNRSRRLAGRLPCWRLRATGVVVGKPGLALLRCVTAAARGGERCFRLRRLQSRLGMPSAFYIISGAAALFLLAASLLRAEPLAAADLKSLLNRIRDRRAAAPQVQASFQEEKNVHLLNKPISSSGKVWFQAPNKFRREVGGNSPSLTISDGQQLWIYYPKFQSVERYSLGKRSPLDAGIAALTAGLNLENVESTYHIAATKAEKGYELELTPRAPSLKRFLQRFAIYLTDDLEVQRSDMLQPNGDRIVTVYSSETRAPIDPKTFEFTPPAGTTVTTPLGR